MFDSFILRAMRKVHRNVSGYADEQFGREACPACGALSPVKMRSALWSELIRQWELSAAWANWMDQREGLRCEGCGANLRSRELARTIVGAMNVRLRLSATSLAELCKSDAMRALEVAEINAAGDLHQFLRTLPGIYYSEFRGKEVRFEDIQCLTYPDESFDLVVNSDVLEHVPDFRRALGELRRVLKPGGTLAFSVPVIRSQKRTRSRAKIVDGQLVHLYPPSYHGSAAAEKGDYLVFHEFGGDFEDIVRSFGLRVRVQEDRRNPALVTYIATRA